MASKKYIEARDNLIKAIDLANEALLRYPNGKDKQKFVYDGVSYTELEWMIKWHNEIKDRRLNEEKKLLVSAKLEKTFQYSPQCQ